MAVDVWLDFVRQEHNSRKVAGLGRMKVSGLTDLMITKRQSWFGQDGALRALLRARAVRSGPREA
eukprot:4626344-Prymnesium_polylepis.1